MQQQPPSQEEINALIAKKRAEVLSRIASLNLPSGHSNSNIAAPQPAVAQSTASLQRENTTAAGIQKTNPLDQASLQDTIAATRARIEARLKNQNIQNAVSSAAASTTVSAQQPTTESVHNSELHPMLRDDYKPLGPSKKRPRLGTTMPRISSIKANQRKEAPRQLKIEREVPESFSNPEKNPYFDPFLGGRRKVEPKARRHAKQFQFVKPGRFVEQAEKQRAEAKIEQLKAEIAERAAKARLEEEVLDVNAIRQEEPPMVEWWDAPFLAGDSYDLDKMKLEGDNSLITIYVQHPIPVEPPEPIRNAGRAPSQLILTRKERKKIRRQRRLEQQREHREKVMLGLLPPEKPKLRMSNFMRVMATQSVPDPTKLEAEVRKQMQERLEKHVAENQARKLTKEQRVEKAAVKAQAEEKKGIVCAVFRIKKLTHPQHRYKVSVNATQLGLTGCALSCPQMSLVIVEGAAKSIKAYKKLMLRRIDWADSQPKLEAHTTRMETSDDDAEEASHDYSDNECHLVWQGEVERRRFTQFRARNCPAELQAKNWLAGAGCDSYWQIAKQYDPNDSITALDPFA